jgi:glutathione S-transferase
VDKRQRDGRNPSARLTVSFSDLSGKGRFLTMSENHSLDHQDTAPTDGLHLYHECRTTASQIVRVVLAARGLQAKDHGAGVPRDPAPASPLPVLVHDGVVVTGLIGILAHIATKFPVRTKRRWGAGALHPNAKVSEEAWLAEAEKMSTVTDALGRSGAQPNIVLIRAIKTQIDAALKTMAWLGGKQPGAADLAWGVIVRRAELAGFPLTNFPNLVRWQFRLRRKMKIDAYVRPPSRRLPWPVPFVGRKRKPAIA